MLQRYGSRPSEVILVRDTIYKLAAAVSLIFWLHFSHPLAVQNQCLPALALPRADETYTQAQVISCKRLIQLTLSLWRQVRCVLPDPPEPRNHFATMVRWPLGHPGLLALGHGGAFTTGCLGTQAAANMSGYCLFSAQDAQVKAKSLHFTGMFPRHVPSSRHASVSRSGAGSRGADPSPRA